MEDTAMTDETIMDVPLPDSLCPIYKEALTKMRNSLTSAETDEQKVQILIEYSDKYLMPCEYWQMLDDLSEDSTLSDKGRGHFYSLDDWQQGPIDFIKEIHIKWDYDSPLHMNIGSSYPKTYMSIIYDLKNLIKFPHHHLNQIYNMLLWHAPSPVTLAMKQTYEKSLKLYEKFEKAGEDDEKWMECINELVDGKFEDKAVIDNIELRLGEGQHYANQKIWKFYIDFLKTRNSARLLFVYSRYCRLFISDRQAKRRYQILKYVKFPIVCKDFVKIIVNLAIKFWKKENQKITSPKIYFKNCKKAVNQTLAFRPSLIRYIMGSANAPVMHKLHKSCKYFFHQKPHPVGHRLFVADSGYRDIPALSFIEQSLYITSKDFDASKLQNFYISKVLHITNDWIMEYLSTKFYKCEAKSINLSNISLEQKDFALFIKSGAVENVYMHCVKINNENGQPVEKDEIRKFVESYGNKLKGFSFVL